MVCTLFLLLVELCESAIIHFSLVLQLVPFVDSNLLHVNLFLSRITNYCYLISAISVVIAMSVLRNISHFTKSSRKENM